MRYFSIIFLLVSMYWGSLKAQCPPGSKVTASAIVTDVRCNLGSDGAVSISVTEGVAPFSYQWSNGSTTASISNLTAGIYSVTITDSIGCKTVLSNIAVKHPDPFIYRVIIHNVSCFGGSDGSLDFSLSGGTPPYSYVWTNVATNTVIGTNEDVSNLTVGIYGLAVTDTNNCRGGIFYLIAQAAEMNVQGAVTDVSCPRASDGSIVLTLTGGTGTKSYSWSSGEHSKNIFNKTAGDYTVTVTDLNGCTAANSFTITEPDPLAATASVTDPTCIGESDGAIDVTPTGGTAPYTFLWSTGAIAEDISNLSAGQYCVTITDSKNCVSDPICFDINDPPQINITADITNVTCLGNADGAIDIAVSGGNPPYTFRWTRGDTSEDLTGLTPGIYTVIVTDANGCRKIETFAVRTENILIISTGITQPLCDEPNSSATVTVSAGTAPYNIQWSNGQSGPTIDSLQAGSYGVTVTDANGCSSSSVADISNVSTLSVPGSVTNTICGSGNVGSISLTVTGGNGSYTFNWSNGALTQNISGLGAGSYSVTVTDSIGCAAVSTFNVVEESELSISAITIAPDCEQSNGSITLTVTGGTPPYSYTWSTGQDSSAISGLESGVYVVTVTDSNGCEETQIIVLRDVDGPQISINKTDITCDNPTGTVEVVITSGKDPFTILWTNGDTTTTITGLEPGIYAVEVTDSSGCSTLDFEILLPTLGVVMEAAMKEPTCNGSTDASIDVTVLQGTAPFTFQWSTGEDSSSISGRGSGTYGVTVTDAGGCSATTTIVIDEPQEITATADSLDELKCGGDSTGSISITVTGGNAPYSYNWSNGETTEDLTNVPAGEYCVVITDAKGCVSDTFCFTLNEPAPLQIQPEITQPTCNGDEDGSISVTVTGGTEPYSYEWGTGDTTQNISDLSAGNYTLTATDENGCTAEGNFTVNEPDSVIAAILDSSNVTCNGDSNGNITVQVSGGTTHYDYHWSNGDTTQTISDLPPGNFQVTVIDMNGCRDSSDIITITEPDSLLVTGNITQPVCSSSGSIDVIVSGGTAPYNYEWSTGEDSSSLRGIGGGGLFEVTVTDANGCMDSASFSLSEPPVMDVLIEVTQELSCSGDTGGTLCARVDGVPGPYFYDWSIGDTTECISGVPAGTYSVTVANGSGCSAYENGFILNEPDQISISPIIDSVTCVGGNDGVIRITVSGGTPPYSYQWSTGDTGNQVDSLSAETVSVTVTDSNECSATLAITVSQPQPFNFSDSEVENATCDTTIDGSITLVVTGGTRPYTFIWDDETSGSLRETLSKGTYAVTVIDANGCTDSTSFTIDGPPCNLPPVAVADTSRIFVCRNDSVDIAVLENDYDPDGDDIYIAAILGTPFNGTVGVNSDQTITYVPAQDFIGVDTFSYIISEIGTQPPLRDTAKVIVAVLPCRPNITIPTGVSPNGDGVNDDFVIPGIEFFPDNVLLIFNRWGNKVIEFHGYKNEWKATNASDEPLPDGTYYFILELHDDANTTYTGYVVVHR